MSKSKNMRDHGLAERLVPHVENARDKAAPLIADARAKAAPIIADAREKAAPMLADARERTAPALADARDKLATEVLPVITAAIAAATEATEEARTEARKRGAATAAALRGELEVPRKTHRLRNLLVLLGLGGVVAFVAKKLSAREATTAWQSSYQPSPASTTSTTAAAGAATSGAVLTDDEGASAPDEALADATETPHAATTPDHPAEEVHLKQGGPDVP
jgi:vacuolar-type H+-ATPase subunit H